MIKVTIDKIINDPKFYKPDTIKKDFKIFKLRSTFIV